MDVFVISPASSRPVWILAIICVLVAAILIALAFTAYASQHSRVELESDRLRLVGDFWGREIPFSHLDVSAARIIDLTQKSEHSLKRRTFGTGLPGYASGWFRLRNGEKALVYLTQRQEVVYVPTLDGYSLLLSVDEPKRLVTALQQ